MTLIPYQYIYIYTDTRTFFFFFFLTFFPSSLLQPSFKYTNHKTKNLNK